MATRIWVKRKNTFNLFVAQNLRLTFDRKFGFHISIILRKFRIKFELSTEVKRGRAEKRQKKSNFSLGKEEKKMNSSAIHMCVMFFISNFLRSCTLAFHIKKYCDRDHGRTFCLCFEVNKWKLTIILFHVPSLHLRDRIIVVAFRFCALSTNMRQSKTNKINYAAEEEITRNSHYPNMCVRVHSISLFIFLMCNRKHETKKW